MTSERIIRIFAGSFILVSLLLAIRQYQIPFADGPSWLWLTAFVGINLLQSGFSRWCLLATILKRFGIKPCCAA